MKINPGLRFIALILIMVGAAMAVRAFEVNKRGDRGQPFTVIIETRAHVKDPDGFEAKLSTHSKQYHLCFRKQSPENDKPLDAGSGTAATCDSKPPGSPHVQQSMSFQTAADMKAIVDLLTTRAAPPATNPTRPETSATPAPHVSQQVESHTPQAAKAIAAALGR